LDINQSAGSIPAEKANQRAFTDRANYKNLQIEDPADL
jgi:hypothetical protein